MTQRLRLLVALATLLLSGCLSPSGREQVQPPDTSWDAIQYRSHLDDPQAKALFQYGRAQFLVQEESYDEAVEALEKAVRLDPGSVFLLSLLGQTYLQLDRADDALRVLQQALSADPDHAQTQMLLGKIHNDRDDVLLATDHLKRAVSLAPGSEEPSLLLAGVLVKRDDTLGAMEVLGAFLDQFPRSIKVRFALARLLREAGLYSSAEEALFKILELHPALDAAHVELGAVHEARGETAQAMESFRKAVEINPYNIPVRHHIARMLIREDRLEEALAQLQEIQRLSPSDPDAPGKIGLLYMELERWDEAVDVLRIMVHRFPDNMEGRYNLGVALENAGDPEEALEQFLSIPDSSDRYSDALVHAAYLLQGMDRLDEAAAAVEKVIALPKHHPSLFVFLGSLKEQQGQSAAAMEAMDMGLEAFPGHVDLLFRKGLLLEKQGRRQEAIALIERVVEAEPGHADGLNYLAYTYAEEGIFLEQALEMATAALKLKEEGYIHDTLGWVLFRLGRLDEASVSLHEAEQALPEDAVVMEHLGELYLSLEDDRKAMEYFRKALELDPENARLRDRLNGVVR